MYCTVNHKTKKALKEAVDSYQELKKLGELTYRTKYGLMPSQMGLIASKAKMPEKVRFYQPGLGPPTPYNGTITVEGPHFPEPHRWYAQVTIKEGEAVSVK